MCVWWILKLYHNFPGLYSEVTACIVHQISGTNFKEWCKWTSHKMGTFSSKYHGNNTKLHEKLSNAAGVEINHLIIMQWFNHKLVYYITIVNVLCERFFLLFIMDNDWYDLLLWIKPIIINMKFSVHSLSYWMLWMGSTSKKSCTPHCWYHRGESKK